MRHQQAAFLQEMGISHWQVRKPALFTAEKEFKQLNLSVFKLLVVCTDQDKSHMLMKAIIRAFGIESDNVAYCSLNQFENQKGTLPKLIWSTLGKIEVSSHYQLLYSPSLTELNNNPTAKKTLWEQFCAYQQ